MMDDSPVPAPPPHQGKPINERVKRAFAERNYELLGELGRGGMGIVYLAQHTKLGRRVALKTLTPDRQTKESSLKRFQREARTFASIRHAHIATLYEYEDQGSIQFLALEYIEGTDLERERRKKRQWTPEEVAKMVVSVASALAETHRKGILHRDIKPANILIEHGTNRMVLTDFGLAKGEQDDTLTATGFAVGTPAYMAPEQITDQFGKPDGRADLFSLATVAYEMLTHEHPFLAPDDLNTMRNIVNRKAKPLVEVDPSIPTRLAQIIESMLIKDPQKRPADAGVVVEQLEAWLKNPTAPAATPAPPSPAPAQTKPAPAPPPAAPTSNDLDAETIVMGAGQKNPFAPSRSQEPPPKPAAQPAPPHSQPPPPGQPLPAGPNKGNLILIFVLIGVGMLIIGLVVGVFVVPRLL